MTRIERQGHFTVEQYLAFEDSQEARHECVGEIVHELPGASVAHSIIKCNVIDALRGHLRRTVLRVYSTAMKLRVGDAFYYPDVMVAAPSCPDARYRTNPQIILEIASVNSEQRDMLEKAVAYRSLHSLCEYVVIWDREQRVVVYRRQPDGWEEETYGEEDKVVRLASLEMSLPMGEIYAEVPC